MSQTLSLNLSTLQLQNRKTTNEHAIVVETNVEKALIASELSDLKEISDLLGPMLAEHGETLHVVSAQMDDIVDTVYQGNKTHTIAVR